MRHEVEEKVRSVTTMLAPSPERGEGVLLHGASGVDRREALDALERQLRGDHPRVLVVRVGPRRDTAGMPERIVDAVERCLDARHAPGGLYEDHGPEVVRSLGAWLFRARSVGASGLVLLLDDIDVDLDARGAFAPELAAWLASLLRALSTRAVSLCATVRAADASGAPALPRELAEAFGQRVNLGAPDAVLARDPTTLVAALAGRTFSPSALHRAIDSWLDLPRDDDDAVVLFSSPLSPPAIPSFETLPPSASPGAPARSVPERERRPVTPAEVLSGWTESLVASVELGGVLRSLRSSVPHDRDAIENAFRASYARLPRRVERVQRGATLLGVDGLQMTQRASRLIEALDDTVRALNVGPMEEDPSLGDLMDLCAGHAGSIGAHMSVTVVFTGLRADLGETFVDGVFGGLEGVRVVAEGLRWAAPCSAERARALTEVIERTPWDDALHPEREHIDGREVYRVTAYARALLDGELGVDACARRVEAGLSSSLQSWLSAWRGPIAMLCVVDVGVGRAEPPGARRLGDGSAFAQLVPWWIVTLGGDGGAR